MASDTENDHVRPHAHKNIGVAGWTETEGGISLYNTTTMSTLMRPYWLAICEDRNLTDLIRLESHTNSRFGGPTRHSV